MTEKTHLPGKDAPLEETIEIASSLLRSQGLEIELDSWKNPVVNCWSVHLRMPECPQIYTNGKGGTKLACEVSAVLEFFERLATNLFFTDYYLGSHKEEDPFLFYPDEKWLPIEDPAVIPTYALDGTELLTEKLRAFYNPEGELTPDLLRDNNIDAPNRGIACLPFFDLRTSRQVYFPVGILNNLYVSNGMAAGNTPTECRAQALAEVIERYVKNQIIARGLCLPAVPESVLARYPKIQRDLAALRQHGFPVLVKDASLGGRFPVVCVLLINPENGGCYAAFGASCRFAVALERTVTELLQGRGLDQLDCFAPPSPDLTTVADSLNLESHFIDSGGLLAWRMFGDQPDFAFSEWDFQGSTATEYEQLTALIHGLGHDIYCAEYRHCGLDVCRLVVPGMSEVYPLDDLVWNNKLTGASLRPYLLKLNQMSIDEIIHFTEHLNTCCLNDEQRVSDVIGVVFAEDTYWSSLRLGELRAMLALASGDLDEAEQWCRWSLNYGFLSTARQKLYQAVQALISFERMRDRQAGTPAFDLFFDAQTLADARRIVRGEWTFPGLEFADTWEALSPPHANLLRLYRRLQAQRNRKD